MNEKQKLDLRSCVFKFIKENNINEDKELDKLLGVVHSITNEIKNKKFKGIRLNGYRVIFTKHSKHRFRVRNINFDDVITVIRNIVGYKFIKNKVVLFKSEKYSFIFDVKNTKLKVVTLIDEKMKDDDFQGDIIFSLDDDNSLYYYIN